MSLKDLDLQFSYNTEDGDVANKFYLPVLSESIEYNRAVAYFNSKSLSIAAIGLKNFILNGGKMKLLCGAELSPEDVKSIMDATNTPEEILTNYFLTDFENIEDEIRKNHIQVLGWMIANNQLEIRIALKLDEFGNPRVSSEGILHFKIGIMKDSENNFLSFNGSNNETGAANSGKNFENFDVFRGWDMSQSHYLRNHIKLFNSTWNGSYESYRIMDVPEIVEQKLIDCAPNDFFDLKFHDDVSSDNSNKTKIMEDGAKPTLFDYQNDAINNWLNNNSKGIFAMATGTGKTFTSLGALEKMIDQEERLVSVITVPNMHLIPQWINSIMNFGLDSKIDELIIIDSAHSKGKELFSEALNYLYNGIIENIVVMITHDSFYNDVFIRLIKDNSNVFKYLLVADEMHGLGSTNRMVGLIPEYNYVLGLSATPERHFDEFGTQFLYDFFDGIVYEFSLGRALNEINERTHQTYLTPYEYHPYFFNLTIEELKDYQDITTKYVRALNNDENKDSKKIETLLNSRSKIIKDAEAKPDILRKILNEMGEDKSGLIIYCSENQIDEVIDIAGNEFHLDVRRFTSKESSNAKKGEKSEREKILDDFAEGIYEVIVAMHCLDEGVDVPSASKAILMCNTTNEREFIQRIGRVIRRDNSKDRAHIYDMVVKPSENISEFSELEEKIYEKELERCDLISKLAINHISLIMDF